MCRRRIAAWPQIARGRSILAAMLTAFGLAAVTLTLLFYALEDRSPMFILAFGGGCLASAVYGFLQGAWPFGLFEITWTAVAVQRWWHRSHSHHDEREAAAGSNRS